MSSDPNNNNEPPYFDEDELINDYTEDMMNEDHPPEMEDIPEEFYNDYELCDNNTNTNTGGVDSNDQKEDGKDSSSRNDDTTSSNTIVEQDADGRYTSDINNGSNAMDLDAAVRAGEEAGRMEMEEEEDRMSSGHTLGSTREDNLYGFERFKGASQWRNAEASAEQLRLKKKLETAEFLLHGTNKKKKEKEEGKSSSSAAPESDIVAHWNRACCILLNKPISSCRDNNSTTKKKANNPLHQYSPSTSSRFDLGQSALKKPMEGCKSTSVTLTNGDRIHIPMKKKDEHKNATTSTNHHRLLHDNKKMHLLERPVKELLRRVDLSERKAERAKVVRQEEQQKNNKGTTTRNVTNHKHHHRDQNQELWVDKYAPSFFTSLLSDERTNREFLRAIRAWDPYVFQRSAPKRPAFFQQQQQQQQQQQSSNEATIHEDTTTQSDIRPEESSRVFLLCGPPGVGKTTLAHVAAKHAGYRPIEINASQDRTTSVLVDLVLRAMDSNTLDMVRKKDDNNAAAVNTPNCVILDEVDGADARSAISSLVEIIKQDLPPSKKSGKHNSSSGNKQHQKHKPHLRRPIIFIANHKFASALKPLLKHCRVFDVHPPSSARLLRRLKTVLANEGLMISTNQHLTNLIGCSGGDIRSCLHTLQFAAARAREVARNMGKNRNEMVDVSNALASALGGGGRGLKDRRGDMAGTLNVVFRRRKKGMTRGGGVKEDRDMERVLKTIERYGETSKTIDSLFSNLPLISSIDPTLDRSATAHEWLSSADTYRSFKTSVAINNTLELFSMQNHYLPLTAGAIHLLCRVDSLHSNTISTSNKELSNCRFSRDLNTGLIQRFMDHMPPKTRNGYVSSVVIHDLIPYTIWLMSAGCGKRGSNLNRAVSSLDILTDREREVFKCHVDRLRGLGLTYVREETQEDQFGSAPFDSFGTHAAAAGRMRLEPEIDKMVNYSNLNISDELQQRTEIPSVVKELLAHGANLEQMRDREQAAAAAAAAAQPTKQNEPTDNIGKHQTSKLTTIDSTKKNQSGADNKNKNIAIITKTSNYEAAAQKKRTSSNMNFLGVGAAKAKAARSARRAALVGFDRSTSKKQKLSHSGSQQMLTKVIRFKYQKGFTQAVRVPCKMEDLF